MNAGAGGTTSLLAVGDIISDRPTGNVSGLERLGSTVRDADISLFNCESPYSNRGTSAGISHGVVAHDPRSLRHIADAGFDVCTLANNHTMDWGTDAVSDCRQLLEENGIAVCGAGKDVSEAHLPVVLERNGIRFGFLGYCCTGPDVIAARDESPGAAVVRAHTAYVPFDYYPATPRISISSWPHQGDVDIMRHDIASLKDQADVVIVSFHWGTMYVPVNIPEYEITLGHMAIDAGADIIVGHSPHILKGIEVYRGRPIAHSLNHLMIEGAPTDESDFRRDRRKLMYVPDTRKTLILKCTFEGSRLSGLSFYPVMLDRTWTDPTVLSKGDSDAQAIYAYMTEITQAAGFDTEFEWEADEVIVSSPSGWA